MRIEHKEEENYYSFGFILFVLVITASILAVVAKAVSVIMGF